MFDQKAGVAEASDSMRDLAGKRILVTAGPTQEAIDPVRYITNHSTGRMGYAIAQRAHERGAEACECGERTGYVRGGLVTL